jgi:ADP-ribose pyrophosphatase YjhB (NUDIX family)
MVPTPSAAEVDRIVTEATLTYLKKRRARVRPFCRRHFSIKGAARLNRKALGKDLLRSPANVVWAVPYLLARSAGQLTSRLGMKQFPEWVKRLPPGFKTDVEREVEWLIYTEMLELPIQQKGRQSTQDALFGEILAHPDLAAFFIPVLQSLNHLARQETLKKNL